MEFLWEEIKKENDFYSKFSKIKYNYFLFLTIELVLFLLYGELTLLLLIGELALLFLNGELALLLLLGEFFF